MGDPKFPRRAFATPFHPWKADRIAEENALQHKYGLKNKKEVWRVKSHLRGFRGQARDLLARARTGDAQAQKETRQLLVKMNRLGLLSETASLDDVLGLNVEQVLGRRLQTQVYLKGYTASMNQARQFITHGHVSVKGERVNVPGYYVKRGEEALIQLTADHSVAEPTHPARPKRAEGEGPPKLKDWKPRTIDRPERGRGPPRGGFGRGPPRGAPAAPAAPAPGAASGEAKPAARETEERKPRRETRQTGGAF